MGLRSQVSGDRDWETETGKRSAGMSFKIHGRE
jgi:hypothetical protein